MENNFTMKTYEQDQDLHIDMKGTFDGASAFALIQEIGKGIYDKHHRIHVETSDVSKVYPFGRTILASNIPKTCKDSVYFSGAMADRIAPKGCAVQDGPFQQGCRKCTGDCENCPCKNLSKNNAQTTLIAENKRA